MSKSLYESEKRKVIRQITEKAQVRRTAWKNIYDWIAAQLALVETSMVKIEEVFLPYMQDREGITFFERMEKRSFLLGDGKQAA